mmetsp:Transcript_89895/g.159947  ORF Transcript_89895/g.159947 Transcript_89895/m.159947 type:complete len:459 (+) Transcript_89895:34-1410(+)|eukprot:CAMPEP_0197624960 /NCGR_PEP_ID=MMETSP1338-20131121/4453_1 /TAXON_ID=43686 ORGANISM="Pelagodinium beii, Strain RCC1491" /NCGR_SAMPLE_ID=MMETSP1338 /ASSEMBLY_ACC=CAM_ASM_000754 /LENGTH=458 /DNA_ID=CAMNT_0043195239 /DNA_START=29 /DNA_END=1405 /DNA_ORIENTATION=+
MVRLDELSDDLLDTTVAHAKAEPKPKSNNFLKRLFTSFTGKKQPSPAQYEARSTSEGSQEDSLGSPDSPRSPWISDMENELRAEDISGGIIVLPDDAPGFQSDSSFDAQDSDHGARTIQAGAGVGDLEDAEEYDGNASKGALKEIEGLKEVMSGLQDKLVSLQRDNGALKKALLARSGGPLPVDVVTEPFKVPVDALTQPQSPSVLVDAKALVDKEDELASALPSPIVTAEQGEEEEEARRASPFAKNKGFCHPSSLLEGCGGIDYEEVPMKVQVGSRSVRAYGFTGDRSSASVTPTTAGGSQLSPELTSTTLTPSIGRHSPWVRQAPMSSRDKQQLQAAATAYGSVQGPPQSWQSSAKESRQSRARRPPPLSLNSSSEQLQGGSPDDEDSSPEAPPEEQEEPPSPPLAPEHSWTPGVGQSWQASMYSVSARPSVPNLHRKPLELPFPDMPSHHDLVA